MSRLPNKLLRFIVWCSARKEDRDDALVTFDEGFEKTKTRFGRAYAHWWSVSQTFRSIPYWVLLKLAGIGATIWAMVT